MQVPLTVTIKEAVQITGLSRTSLYSALKKGELLAIKAGRRTLIHYSALENYLSSLPAYEQDQGLYGGME
jgi:excisionase family DNA binding protein|tara:strand:- start:12 stop:221 length:210 start_codon:yes stop_codon:yes gene_type:complete